MASTGATVAPAPTCSTAGSVVANLLVVPDDDVDEVPVAEVPVAVAPSAAPRPVVDLSGAVGVSSEDVLHSADLPDNAALSDDDERDVSKVGVGSDYPDVGLTPFMSF
jgi:hypothetical protein